MSGGGGGGGGGEGGVFLPSQVYSLFVSLEGWNLARS